jgi:undecaprenyl-diphosphatase
MIAYAPLLQRSMPTVFALSATGTAILALAVTRGWAVGLDTRLLRAWPVNIGLLSDGKPTKRATAARDVAALGGDAVRLVFLLGCVAELLADRRATAAGLLVGIYALARLALFLIKAAIRRPRPDLSGHGMVTYTSSFPSGHTFMTVVLSLSAAVIIPRDATAAVIYTGIGLALAVSLAIGVTRMSFGVHWPSDVLAGWLAAVAWVSGWLLLL